MRSKYVLVTVGFAVLTSLILSHVSRSVAEDSGPMTSVERPDKLRKEGRLISVHISMGNPIRIFVVGKEEAQIDVSKLNLVVKRLKPYPGKVLSVDRFDHYFVVNNPEEFKDATHLEITADVKGKKETLNFNLNKPLP